MENDLRERRNRQYATRRSIIDYGMGALYLGFAFIMFFGDKVGFNWIVLNSAIRYMFGGICVLYGGFRIYRGYRKDYF